MARSVPYFKNRLAAEFIESEIRASWLPVTIVAAEPKEEAYLMDSSSTRPVRPELRQREYVFRAGKKSTCR